jgi:hypothetical protein
MEAVPSRHGEVEQEQIGEWILGAIRKPARAVKVVDALVAVSDDKELMWDEGLGECFAENYDVI